MLGTANTDGCTYWFSTKIYVTSRALSGGGDDGDGSGGGGFFLSDNHPWVSCVFVNTRTGRSQNNQTILQFLFYPQTVIHYNCRCDWRV